MKLDKEVLNINSKSCCCKHFHKSGCLLKDNKVFYHNKIHVNKSEKCKCRFSQPNYHNEEC